MTQAFIPQSVYSRGAGEYVVVLNVQDLRIVTLDDVETKLWKHLEAQPEQVCALKELVASYAPRGGAAAEVAMQRIHKLAKLRVLELRE